MPIQDYAEQRQTTRQSEGGLSGFSGMFKQLTFGLFNNSAQAEQEVEKKDLKIESNLVHNQISVSQFHSNDE